MQPSIIRHGDLLQLSYDLPHRASNSIVYPLKSSNGSTIILYGHEDGLRVIWYGGKPFQKARTSEPTPKTNGATKSEAMVIDLSDDEGEKSKSSAQATEFEEEEAEIDPKRPYRDILRQLDVSLGTTVTEIAVPPIQASNIASSPEAYPEVLKTGIVVAVACADLSIRLLSLPLTPPSPEALHSLDMHGQLVKVSGSNGHHDFISSISVTYISETAEREVDVNNKSRSRSRGRSTKSGPEWSFLIASISNTGSGLLLIHQIPVSELNELISFAEALVPIQRQYLGYSLSGCKLAFNPSPSPAERSSNLLLTLRDAGCVKLYQVNPRSSHARDRRGSGATIDSVASSSRSSRGPSFPQGKFLLTLYAGFLEATHEIHSQSRRKRILDAVWVLGGRAVVALLEDGEWGVWDVEAAGPSSSATTPNLFKGHSKVSDLQGGSLTRFAIQSVMPASGPTVAPSTIKAKPTRMNGLTPMTPHTRKTRTGGLFHGTAWPSTALSRPTSSIRGSISALELAQSPHAKSSTIADESILFHYGDVNAYLASLNAFWRSATASKGSFDSTSSTRLLSLPTLHLGSQAQKSIMQLPPTHRASGGIFGGAQSLPDVLITTDHRLVMLVAPISDDTESNPKAPGTLATRIMNTDLPRAVDEMLDIDDIDKVLNGMDHRQSVNFRHDNDVDMDSPTPSTGARSAARKPLSGLTSARAKLFS